MDPEQRPGSEGSTGNSCERPGARGAFVCTSEGPFTSACDRRRTATDVAMVSTACPAMDLVHRLRDRERIFHRLHHPWTVDDLLAIRTVHLPPPLLVARRQSALATARGPSSPRAAGNRPPSRQRSHRPKVSLRWHPTWCARSPRRRGWGGWALFGQLNDVGLGQ